MRTRSDLLGEVPTQGGANVTTQTEVPLRVPPGADVLALVDSRLAEDRDAPPPEPDAPHGEVGGLRSHLVPIAVGVLALAGFAIAFSGDPADAPLLPSARAGGASSVSAGGLAARGALPQPDGFVVSDTRGEAAPQSGKAPRRRTKDAGDSEGPTEGGGPAAETPVATPAADVQVPGVGGVSVGGEGATVTLPVLPPVTVPVPAVPLPALPILPGQNGLDLPR
jgi:hypothetical protein